MSGGRGGGLRSADRARFASRDHAVEVIPARLEPFDLHVHRVTELGGRHGRSGLGDVRKPFVLGDLPVDCDGIEERSGTFEGRRCEPCPEDDAARQRVPGRDTECEGVGRESDPSPSGTRRHGAKGDEARHAATHTQKVPAGASQVEEVVPPEVAGLHNPHLSE